MSLEVIGILTAVMSSPQCLEQQPFLLIGSSPTKAHPEPLAGGQVAYPEISCLSLWKQDPEPTTLADALGSVSLTIPLGSDWSLLLLSLFALAELCSRLCESPPTACLCCKRK